MDLKLPDLGEGVMEGEIVKWHVKPGDRVKEDQVVLEIMTDKATVEIPVKGHGVVGELMFKEGDVAKVGQVIMRFEGSAGASPAPAKTEAPAAKAPAPAVAKSASPPAPAAKAPAPARGAANPDPQAAPAVRKAARLPPAEAMRPASRTSISPSCAVRARTDASSSKISLGAALAPVVAQVSPTAAPVASARKSAFPCGASAARSPKKWRSRCTPWRTSPT